MMPPSEIMDIAKENAETFVHMLNTCYFSGTLVKPRGEEIRELQDFTLSINPLFPFMTFGSRNYKIDYFKKEMLWKLGADRFDESIKEHAAMWAKVQNDDGSFNSNYGQYWFGEDKAFWRVVSDLAKDPDSRQAVIPMLKSEHMDSSVRDKVCTMGLGFRIRNNQLLMSVHMRSSDQIWGLGTDIPTFSFLYRMVFAALRQTYPTMEIGPVTITAMSSHIYHWHYEMVRKIIEKGSGDYVPECMPFASGMAEVLFLVSTKGKYTSAPEGFDLANWLISKD